MPRRDFAVAPVPETQEDPIEFGFAGQVFRCVPKIGREHIAGVVAGLQVVPQPDWPDFEGAMLRYVGQVIDFLRSVVEEPDRFVATIAKHGMDDGLLAEIFGFVAGEYAQRLAPLEPVPTRPNTPPVSEPASDPVAEWNAASKRRTTLADLSGILTSPKAGNRAIGEIGEPT